MLKSAVKLCCCSTIFTSISGSSCNLSSVSVPFPMPCGVATSKPRIAEVHPVEQHSYVKSAKEYGYDVLVFDQIIDNHFMQQLEYKLGDVTFVRVDSDTTDNLVQKDEERESVLSEKEQDKVKEIFTSSLGDLKGGQIELKPLSPNDHPVIITKPEFMRRMKDMAATGIKLTR